VDTAEVIVSEVQRNGGFQVRQFLAEGIRQPRESANPQQPTAFGLRAPPPTA
jgi:hypothetical protein